ncbi:MAG: argininosuccinate lyase [bacterium]
MSKARKPWGGRFSRPTRKSVEQFTESVSFDYRLAPFDLRAGRAHAKALKGAGLLSAAEWRRMDKALREIESEVAEGKFKFKPELEDVHMNIERRLFEKIGGLAGKLHTARSRNDLVSADLRLYLVDAIGKLDAEIAALQKALVDRAEGAQDTLMPGYTHLQRAQPVLLAHHLLAYFEMFRRDRERLADAAKRINISPLGAAALAGAALPIDWEAVAEELGFSGVAANSVDAVSDRDFVLEILSAAAVCMIHLSRFAEEVVLWSSSEFGFVELPDELSTGSSIMPHKKNPDVAELIRARAGRAAGALIGALTMMKGLPLTYNRDLQEDKVHAFESVENLSACLRMAAELVAGMEFRAERMERAADVSFMASVDLTDYLVLKGLPFRDAHTVVGRLVAYCEKGEKDLRELTVDEFREFSKLFEKDVVGMLDPRAGAARKKSPGSTSPASVKSQIRRARNLLRKSK